MTFQHAWVLVFLLLPLGWAVFEMRRTRRTVALVLKALTFIAIILALAEPRITLPETKMAVAVLVDTSASVSQQDLTRASALAGAIDKARGRHWVRVLPFARSVRDLTSSENGWRFQSTAGEAGRATDIESAIQEAISSLPSDLVPRLVLISDGKENAGSITRAAWQAQRLGIPIDTIPLQGRPQPALRLESVTLPTVAFTGEQFPIDLSVVSPAALSGTVEVSAEGKLLGSNPISLEPGDNQVRVHASLSEVGALNLSGVIRAGQSGEIRFDRAVNLRRPKVLFVSQDPAGTEAHLMQTLAAAQFEVDRTGDPLHGDLAGYQLAVLNNLDLEALPASRKDEIEKFVQQGGGLLVIGGEHNVYPDDKKIEDALDRTLPAKVAPPRSPEGTAVVLIIDKSSSMEGKKIELARLAAVGVVDNLRAIDQVGVLIFDNSFQWAVPMRRAEDRSLIKRLISGIIPDGGTQIAPALAEAFHKIIPVHATFKHIVLMTDGISEEGDSLDLSKEAAAQHVTISTVGLGQDVNRAYLEKVAAIANGKSYFLNEPSGLEQILIKDVMEHTGSTAVERPLQPIVSKNAEILSGVGIDTAPALKGYVRFIAKPTADTILKIDEKDPLLHALAVWLGTRRRVRLRRQERDGPPTGSPGRASTGCGRTSFAICCRTPKAAKRRRTSTAPAAIWMLNISWAAMSTRPRSCPRSLCSVPTASAIPWRSPSWATNPTAARSTSASCRACSASGRCEESRAFPEVGYYQQEQELLDYGSNPFLLRTISQFTGGRFNPAPRQVFDAAGRSQTSVLQPVADTARPCDRLQSRRAAHAKSSTTVSKWNVWGKRSASVILPIR